MAEWESVETWEPLTHVAGTRYAKGGLSRALRTDSTVPLASQVTTNGGLTIYRRFAETFRRKTIIEEMMRGVKTSVKVIGYCEGERCESDALLIAPDVAVLPDHGTLYFIRVKPSDEGGSLFDDIGLICDIIIPANSNVDISDLPAEALTFAMWAASKRRQPLPVAV